MKSEDIIEAWIEQKSNVKSDMEYADVVMQRIERAERRRRRCRFDLKRVPEWIWVHPIVKTGWIGAASVIGFIRGIFLLRVALGG